MSEIEHLKEIIKERSITSLHCLHLPKTGGTFCKNILDRIGHNTSAGRRRHEHSYFCKGFESVAEQEGFQPGWKDPKTEIYHSGYITQNELKSFLVFAVVRNPFDLLVSHYSYRGEKSLTELNAPVGWGFANQTHKIASFEEYIQKFTDVNFAWFSRYLQRFLYFPMYDDHGKCCVDIILFNENLDAGLKKLTGLFGHAQLPHLSQARKRINTSRNRDYRTYYNDATRKLVEEKCKLELEMFGYSFEGGNEDREILIPTNKFDVEPVVITGMKI